MNLCTCKCEADSGQGAWTSALGTKNLATGAPMQVNSHMRIGSITKTMTATVILQLADRHKLSLDDPVSTYLSHVPNGMHIIIRQLLNMISGLFSYTEDLGFEQQAWGTDPFTMWTLQELLAIAYKHQLLLAGFAHRATHASVFGASLPVLPLRAAAYEADQRAYSDLGGHP